MAAAAVWLLTLAVAAGTLLGLLHLKATNAAGRPPMWAGIAHGAAGAVGFGLLLLALQGPARGAATGVGSFGTTAAWLFVASLLAGAVLLARRRKSPTVSMMVHAGLAVTGYVLILAWDSLG